MIKSSPVPFLPEQSPEGKKDPQLLPLLLFCSCILHELRDHLEGLLWVKHFYHLGVDAATYVFISASIARRKGLYMK
jgi:hypothetical protein